MMKQLDTAKFNPQIKRYILSNSQDDTRIVSTRIVFYPQAPDAEQGKGQLEYQGPEGKLTFVGDEISYQRGPLGLLVSVVLKPNADAGQLDLVLALPPINLGGKKAQEFETIAIKTRGQGFVIDPSGATLTYTVQRLQGAAQAVILPDTLPTQLEDNSGEIKDMSDMQKILEITELNVSILESFPPQLKVLAKGTVPSAGWTNPQLIPYVYIQAPPDGIYDFDFVATPPKGVAAQVVSPIRVSATLPGQGVKGIRVHASLNAKEILLNTEESPCKETQAV